MSYFAPPRRLPTPAEANELATRGARFEVVVDAALNVSPSPSHWTLRPRTPLGRLAHAANANPVASLLAVLAIQLRSASLPPGPDSVRRLVRLCSLSARGDAQAALGAHSLPTIADILAATFGADEPKAIERELVRHLHDQRIEVAPETPCLVTHLLRALAVYNPEHPDDVSVASVARLIGSLTAHAIDWTHRHYASSEGAPR